MDVLKYLKKADSLLQEAAAADQAREMGLEYAGYGKWKDPRTGQVTHKSVKQGGQTSLQKLDAPEAPGRPQRQQQQPQQPQPQGQQPQQGELEQEDPEVPPVSDQMARVVPGGPTATALDNAEYKQVVKGLQRGRGSVMSKERDDQIKLQARDMIAQMRKEKEAMAAADAEAESQAELDKAKRDAEIQAINDEEASKKDKSDFKTVDEVIVDMDEDDGSYANDDEAFDAEYEQFTKEAETMMKALADRQRKMMEKKFASFTEKLQNIPSATDKRSFLKSMAHAKTFEGRVNAGAGKNNLGYADVQNLMANRDRLLEGYGDGSPEQIKKFVDSVRSNKVDQEFVDASFEILPKAFKDSLSGKGQVTNDKYVSDDKAHKDMHYLGKDEDGNVRRGMASNKDRAKLMWRIYLEQGGRDAYTGLPLDIQAMDLEHVRGFNNKDGGKPGKEEWEQRENDDNFTLINSNINQKKVDMSMKDFFEREVDPNKDKSEEDFGGIEKLFEKQNQIGDVGDQLVKTLLGEGGKGLNNEVTRQLLSEHFGEDDKRYTDLRNELRQVATDPKDKKKAAGMKSKLGKQLLKATGLSRGITDPSGRRTVALQENVYRGFLQSMANAKPEDRQRYMEGWAEAIKAGNEARAPKAVNKKLIELGLIDEDILGDKKAGKVFKEEYTVKQVSTVHGKTIEAVYNSEGHLLSINTI